MMQFNSIPLFERLFGFSGHVNAVIQYAEEEEQGGDSPDGSPSAGDTGKPPEDKPSTETHPAGERPAGEHVRINAWGPILVVLSILTAALLVFTGYFSPASLLGVLFVPAFYTYLLLCDKKLYAILPAAVAVVAGFIMPDSNSFYFLNLVLPIALVCVFYYSTLKNYSKTSTVLRMIIVMCIWFIGVFALLVFLETGSFTRGTVAKIMNEIFDYNKKVILSLGSPANFKEMTGVSFEKTLDRSFDLIRMLLPSILIGFFSALSYFAALIYGGLARITRSGELLAVRSWSLTVTKLTAGLFFGSYLCSFFAGGDDSLLFQTVVLNLVGILTPPLFVLGVKDINRMLQRLKLPAAVAVLLTGAILLFVFIIFFGYADKLIAFIGFWAVIYNRTAFGNEHK